MTPCPKCLISPNLCGCAPPAAPEVRPDVTRNFSELEIGARVRFARTTREVAACPTCGLPAVPVADLHLRRWPFREDGMAVERKALRTVYVHDATVGPTGYVLGGSCTVYEQLKKRKRK